MHLKMILIVRMTKMMIIEMMIDMIMEILLHFVIFYFILMLSDDPAPMNDDRYCFLKRPGAVLLSERLTRFLTTSSFQFKIFFFKSYNYKLFFHKKKPKIFHAVKFRHIKVESALNPCLNP